MSEIAVWKKKAFEVLLGTTQSFVSFSAFFDSTMPNTTKTNFFALYWLKKIDNVNNHMFTKGNLP